MDREPTTGAICRFFSVSPQTPTKKRQDFFGAVAARLVGPEGAQWDDVAIVEYPSYASFLDIVDLDAYRSEANHHRLAALEDFRLFVAEAQGVGAN